MGTKRNIGIGLVIMGTIFMFVLSALIGVGGGIFFGSVWIAIGITYMIIDFCETKETVDKYKAKMNNPSASQEETHENIKSHIRFVVKKAIDEYEKNNKSKVNQNSVYDLYFRLCDNEIKTLTKVEEVYSLTFGIISVATICCMIIDNDGYQSVRNNPNLLNKISGLFVHEVSDDKLKDFRNIMDTFCFVMLSEQVDKISEDDTTDNRDFSLNIESLICVSVKNFSIKHNLPLSEEATEYIDEILNKYM